MRSFSTNRRELVCRWPSSSAGRSTARIARTSGAGYWNVALVSSAVRSSGLYYQCELRVSVAGINLSEGRDPSELCRWQEQTGQDFSKPGY